MVNVGYVLVGVTVFVAVAASGAVSVTLLWSGLPFVTACSLILLFLYAYVRSDDSPVPPNDFCVGIIGAGFSGIAMGIKLKKMGIKYTIYEKDSSIGGTWRANTYPGCACDVPSHLYSLSTDLKPDWSLHYSKRAEILQYIKDVVAKHQLHIKTGMDGITHEWDENLKMYKTTFANGQVEYNNILIAGPGPFWFPNIPEFPGANSFKGPMFHSLYWDQTCEYKGKRMAVIGTGASAVQIVPSVAEDVNQLTVFQRTACWVPRKVQFRHPDWLIWLFRNVPGLQRLYRVILFLAFDARYWLVFRKGSPMPGFMQRLVENEMRRTIANEDLAKKLIPNIEMGCKRITPSNEYLQAFGRKNVELVTDPIDRITPEGIITKNGTTYEVDIIVWATGFDMFKMINSSGDVVRDGVKLHEKMGSRPFFHLNVTAEGYPNFFYLLGTHTGIGHHSILFLVECEVEYIAQCLRHMILNNRKMIEVRPSAIRKYKEFIDKNMESTVFVSGCNSYYKTDGGSGEVFALWPCSLIKFWTTVRRLNANDYVWS